LLDPAALRIDPRSVLARKETARTDVLGHASGTPRRGPVAARDRRLRAMQALLGRLEVDPGVRRQGDADVASALERNDMAQLREESAQRSLDVRRRRVAP